MNARKCCRWDGVFWRGVETACWMCGCAGVQVARIPEGIQCHSMTFVSSLPEPSLRL